MISTKTLLAVVALAVAGSDAFVSTSSSVARTDVSMGSSLPYNGGPEGSELVPAQYGQVDAEHPWGYSERTYTGPTERIPAWTSVADQSYAGPMNGGVHGSSILPYQYEKVDVENPWGGRRNPAIRSMPLLSETMPSDPSHGGQTRVPRRRPSNLRRSSSYGTPVPTEYSLPQAAPAWTRRLTSGESLNARGRETLPTAMMPMSDEEHEYANVAPQYDFANAEKPY